ncbi:MAG: DUF3592 domain-containing protein [Planctomycetota bacterium]|nr:DUF3592 domain-containing protein [Planctomycetota bacterium]
MPTAVRVFIIVWAAGFVLAGLLISAWAYFDAKEAIRSGSWPSTEGEVTSQKIDVSRSRDSDGRTKTSYTPRLAYQFRVNGKVYRGNRMQIGQWSYNTRAKASAAINRLTDDTKCTVFYDPNDPKTCTLEAGFKFHHALFIGFGLLFCVVGIGGGWLFLSGQGVKTGTKKKPRKKSNRTELMKKETRPRAKTSVTTGPRAQTLEENITRWGREHIGTGDDTLVDWEIISSFDDQHLSYVEVEPFPKAVGYDKFIFVISFTEQPADLVATYCLEDGQFSLFSRNAETDEDLPDSLSAT